mgnify:CR=1 FL=1
MIDDTAVEVAIMYDSETMTWNVFYEDADGLELLLNDDGSDKDYAITITGTDPNGLEEDLTRRFPSLKIKRLVGMDSGLTKKEYFEDINKTLEATNVFICSHVIASGVDITIPVKKI